MPVPCPAQAASPWAPVNGSTPACATTLGSRHLASGKGLGEGLCLGWFPECHFRAGPAHALLRQDVFLTALVQASESTGVTWRLSRQQLEGYPGFLAFLLFRRLSTLLWDLLGIPVTGSCCSGSSATYRQGWRLENLLPPPPARSNGDVWALLSPPRTTPVSGGHSP